MDITCLQYILASLVCTECIAGGMINLIIVAANIMKWRTMKFLNTVDEILNYLAISRSLCLFNGFLHYFLYLLGLWDILNYLAISRSLCLFNGFLHYFLYLLGLWDVGNPWAKSSVSVITMFLYSTNLWFATVLCVFYCVKITSYSWKFFIFLKTKISTLVPWFLLASLLISISSSLPFGLTNHGMQKQNLTNVSMENLTLSGAQKFKVSLNLFMLLLLGSILPFLLFFAAIFLLLHSLWMHTRRMRSSGSGFRSPNLKSHFNAVKSMSLFLVLQTMYLVITVHFLRTIEANKIAFWIYSILTYSPPAIHSLYIILSNSELKKTCISILYVLICCAQE
ncbi:hypothetical protein GDO81_028880 [Engystomops pustulosus]|uniref:Taste receptor type 2 n=1 Tax=Engystomops pustulosus TaxID=76066 RepID=A0AAV6ZS27_ENGPU|nr:hypothetical protein GDO81_028880 [Engystomops pustulosus]